MLFQRKIDRAMEWSRKHGAKQSETHGETPEGELPSMEDLRAEANEEMDLEKGDFFAMLLSALIVILPAGIIVLLILCGFMFFL